MTPLSDADSPPTLLSVIELLGYPNLRPLFECLGYRVLTEFAVRKAIKLDAQGKAGSDRRRLLLPAGFSRSGQQPGIAVATAQGLKDVKVLVLYESAHEHALERLSSAFASMRH